MNLIINIIFLINYWLRSHLFNKIQFKIYRLLIIVIILYFLFHVDIKRNISDSFNCLLSIIWTSVELVQEIRSRHSRRRISYQEFGQNGFPKGVSHSTLFNLESLHKLSKVREFGGREERLLGDVLVQSDTQRPHVRRKRVVREWVSSLSLFYLLRRHVLQGSRKSSCCSSNKFLVNF